MAGQMKTEGVSVEEVERLESYLTAKVSGRAGRQAVAPILADAEDPDCEPERPHVYWTQASMNARARAAAGSADAQLREAFTELLTHYTPEAREPLVEAQSAWEKFRELQARAAASNYLGGSMAPLVYDSEIAALTEQRLAAIKEALEVQRTL